MRIERSEHFLENEDGERIGHGMRYRITDLMQGRDRITHNRLMGLMAWLEEQQIPNPVQETNEIGYDTFSFFKIGLVWMARKVQITGIAKNSQAEAWATGTAWRG